MTLLHRHFLAYPGYAGEAVRRVPELAPLIGARDVDAAALATAGPSLIEYDLDLPDALVAASRVVAAPDSPEPQARRFAAWQAFLAAHRACRLAAPSVADEKLAEARVFFGEVSELASCAKLRSPIEP